MKNFLPGIPEEGASFAIQLIDVLLVAYLVYRLLLVVRGTRAWRILGGVTIYLLAWFVSEKFGLRTLHFILDKTLALGPVALVFLLLPELRMALEGFGKLGFWPDRLGGGEDTMHSISVDEIVAAVSELSASRTGALMVIERSRRLTEVAEKGVALEARVTSPLLIQIFFDRTPLHDGAAIIRGDKIVAAACQLPLSESRLPNHLHLRHRAAVGISETSDAISIVISEERGTIAYAMDGRIWESVGSNEIREVLNGMRAERTAKRRQRTRKRGADEEVAV